MKKGLITLLGLAAVCASTATFAGHVDNGIYVDLGAGYGKTNIKGFDKNNGFAGTVNLGYQFTPMLAAEVGATGFKKVYNVRGYNTHVAAKLILPVGNKVEAFGKVGAAYVQAVSVYGNAEKHVRPFVGAGLSYYLSDNVAATAQVEATTRFKDELPAQYAGTLGVTYKVN